MSQGDSNESRGRIGIDARRTLASAQPAPRRVSPRSTWPAPGQGSDATTATARLKRTDQWPVSPTPSLRLLRRGLALEELRHLTDLHSFVLRGHDEHAYGGPSFPGPASDLTWSLMPASIAGATREWCLSSTETLPAPRDRLTWRHGRG
jgi:hypothetical protein